MRRCSGIESTDKSEGTCVYVSYKMWIKYYKGEPEGVEWSWSYELIAVWRNRCV